MQPHIRAARDRIAAWLDREFELASDGAPQRAVVLAFTDRELPFPALHAADLRAVLAALDQQPDGIIVCDHAMTEAEFDDLKQSWRRRHLAARHDDPADAELCPSCGQRRDAYRTARQTSDQSEAEDTP